MKRNKNTWFDDPEWEALRRQVSKQAMPDFAKKPQPKTPTESQPKKSQPSRPDTPDLSFLDKIPAANVQSPPAPESQSVPALDFQKATTTPKPKAPKSENIKKVHVSVNLSLPAIPSRLQFKRSDLAKLPKQSKFLLGKFSSLLADLSKKQKWATATAALVLIMLVTGPFLIKASLNDNTKETKGESTLAPQKPDFTTVLPDGTKEAATSDRIAYDPQKKVASFTDRVGGVEITVSQQPLPEAYKQDPPASIEKVAQTISANDVITTKSGKAYIGTSAEGPQTVVLTKKSLLIFILAKSKVDNKEWISYIDSLL